MSFEYSTETRLRFKLSREVQYEEKSHIEGLIYDWVESTNMCEECPSGPDDGGCRYTISWVMPNEVSIFGVDLGALKEQEMLDEIEGYMATTQIDPE